MLPSLREGRDARSFCLALLSDFDKRVKAQHEAAQSNPRTRSFAWPNAHVDVLKERLIEFGRKWYESLNSSVAIPRTRPASDFEEELKTSDGKLIGKIDRVDRKSDGVVLVDYKSASAPDDEALASAEEQLAFYAYLWWRHNGAWPRYTIAQFVAVDRTVVEETDVERCLDIGRKIEEYADSLDLVNQLPATKVASPGEACRYCAYKPWCKPYWDSNPDIREGIAGIVESVHRGTNATMITLVGSVRSDVRYPDALFPQLANIDTGKRVRVLSPEVGGTGDRFSLTLREYSEVFIVEDTPNAE